jgi:hypothetical protein
MDGWSLLLLHSRTTGHAITTHRKSAMAYFTDARRVHVRVNGDRRTARSMDLLVCTAHWHLPIDQELDGEEERQKKQNCPVPFLS